MHCDSNPTNCLMYLRKYAFIILIFYFFAITGCSSNINNPTSPIAQPEEKGNINGIVYNSVTGKPVPGIKVVINQLALTVRTDSIGRFTFPDIKKGTYELDITDPGFQNSTLKNVIVEADKSTTTTAITKPINWKYRITDNNANVALLYTEFPKIKGIAMTEQDIIGCFYDSLGTIACAGYCNFPSDSNLSISVAIWGDDFITPNIKEGFSEGEPIKWKLKRGSDGKVFDISVSYLIDLYNYKSGSLNAIKSLLVLTD